MTVDVQMKRNDAFFQVSVVATFLSNFYVDREEVNRYYYVSWVKTHLRFIYLFVFKIFLVLYFYTIFCESFIRSCLLVQFMKRR